jgi:hypothetical protein
MGLVKFIHSEVREDGIVYYYDIEPEVKGNIKEPIVKIPELEMRPLDWSLWDKGKTATLATCLPTTLVPLHSLECVGNDTYSALSVSTERRDFTFIDDSDEAKESVSLRGIRGDQSTLDLAPFVPLLLTFIILIATFVTTCSYSWYLV